MENGKESSIISSIRTTFLTSYLLCLKSLARTTPGKEESATTDYYGNNPKNKRRNPRNKYVKEQPIRGSPATEVCLSPEFSSSN